MHQPCVTPLFPSPLAIFGVQYYSIPAGVIKGGGKIFGGCAPNPRCALTRVFTTVMLSGAKHLTEIALQCVEILRSVQNDMALHPDIMSTAFLLR